jgi:hypothetical protein
LIYYSAQFKEKVMGGECSTYEREKNSNIIMGRTAGIFFIFENYA